MGGKANRPQLLGLRTRYSWRTCQGEQAAGRRTTTRSAGRQPRSPSLGTAKQRTGTKPVLCISPPNGGVPRTSYRDLDHQRPTGRRGLIRQTTRNERRRTPRPEGEEASAAEPFHQRVSIDRPTPARVQLKVEVRQGVGRIPRRAQIANQLTRLDALTDP